MDIYLDKVLSKTSSLELCGMSVYTICSEQDCNSIVDSFLSEMLTYDMCSYIKKAVHNVASQEGRVTTMYLFTEERYSEFCTVASEDRSTAIVESVKVRSIPMLSNVLFSTDKYFITEVPKLQKDAPIRYKKEDVYIVRLLHRVSDINHNVMSEDIVIYVPSRYMLCKNS